jgi:PAS domain S-box-containing protein
MADGSKIPGNTLEIGQLFLSLFQHMAEGVALHEVVLDAAGSAINYRILDINPQYPYFTGLTREQVVGKLATEAYGTKAPPYLEEFTSVGLGAAPRRFETYFAPLDRHYEISVAPLGYGFFATIFMDVSIRKRQEQKLRAKTDELDQFFCLSIDLLCIATVDSKFLRLNPAWTNSLSWKVEELEGKSFLELVHPDDLSATQAAIALLSSGQNTTSFTNRYRAKDGSYRFFEWRTAPAPDGLLYAAARDVTQRIASEEALRTSEERFHRIFELIPNPLTLSSMDGVLLDCNQAFCKISQYSREELVGRSIEDLGVWANYAQRNALIQLLKNFGEVHDFETRFRSQDGHMRTVLLSVRKLNLREQEVMLTLARDITEQRGIEQRMLHTQKLESLCVLAGGIAHDFNNLLTGVLGNADLALRDLPSTSPLNENLNSISTAARKAAELCRQLLAYSGKGRFLVQPVNLEQLIAEMGQLLAASVSKKAVLQFQFAKDIPAIQADAAQVRQVIMNLIVNASESFGEGGGLISVRTGLVDVDAAYLKGCLCAEDISPGKFVFLEVTDNGQGMDRDTLQRLFDPFFSTKFIGRGLGLAAVLGIMRGHRGGICVYSEPARGSRFKLLFPALTSSVANHVVVMEDDVHWKGSGQILVVDDEETVRNLGKRMLERAGFTVLTATDGREALKLFIPEQDRIRLVLLDLTMPNLDGEACFRLLQEQKPDVKVVLTSGYNEQDVVNLFAGKGLAGFLQKPFSSGDLLNKIREVLASH